MKSPALALFLVIAACSTEPQPQPEHVRTGPLDVRTLSFPAQWLVEQVGGEHVQVRTILPVGTDAPFWHPEAELIAGLADSDLIVGNGAGFEAWVATATLPSDKLVLTAQGLDLIQIEGVTHSHGAGGSHSHSGTDPHTWGSPSLFAQQAKALAAALAQADPTNAPDYSTAADALGGELAQISEAYAEAFSRAGDTRMAANHPAFEYLEREMKVDIHAFGFEPTVVPSPEQIAEFEAWAGGAPSPVLFWEAIPTSECKAAFPDGVRHVWLDPLEQPGRAGRYDYLAQVRTNIAAIGGLFPLAAQGADPTPRQGPPKPGAPADNKPGPRQGGKGIKAGKAGK